MERMNSENNYTNEELAFMFQQGNELALNTLLEVNRRYIYHLANQFYVKALATVNCTLDDLVALAHTACWKAARDYSAEKGTKFITLFTHCMQYEVYGYFKQDYRKKHKANTVSLNAPVSSRGVGESKEMYVSDFTADVRQAISIDYISFAVEFATFEKEAPAQTVYAFKEVFFKGRSHREVSEDLGISQPYLSRILRKARDEHFSDLY